MRQKPILIFKDNSHELLTSYLIIDCAHFEDATYQNLMNNPHYKAISLFRNTVQEINTLSLSPVLIELKDEIDEEHIGLFLEIEQTYPNSVMWLWSDRNIASLASHLQKLLFGEGLYGYKVMYRFYDPRCVHELLELFRLEPSIKRDLNSVVTWAYRTGDRYEYLWSDPEHPMRNI